MDKFHPPPRPVPPPIYGHQGVFCRVGRGGSFFLLSLTFGSFFLERPPFALQVFVGFIVSHRFDHDTMIFRNAMIMIIKAMIVIEIQILTFQELPVGESAFDPFLHQTLSVMSTAQT